ncbi:CocE/NonD family hydrolase [Granulicella paludicola]|uniref:CocE/NonD family hydrolase n=1 Tax=Granulicella paludicola TaxID=474951 RepID=UPI0021E0AC1D|nr:CocE/NonD family hydrolase [Granulicella paludicola]
MRLFHLALSLSVTTLSLSAQSFRLPPLKSTETAVVDAAMPALAKQVLSKYHNDNPYSYCSDAFRLQLVAGQYAEAEKTLEKLQGLNKTIDSGHSRENVWDLVFFEIYAKAKHAQQERQNSFADDFRQSFRDVFRSLDSINAALAINTYGSTLDPYGPQISDSLTQFHQVLDAQQGKTSLSLDDAKHLIRLYLQSISLSATQPLSGAMVEEDDHRRYQIQDTLVDTPDHASIETLVVRPAGDQPKLPTLMGFTIYANPIWSMQDARLTAAHGYAAVVAYTRGKGSSPDKVDPLEHDGADADAVIEWISKQSWSDGRVGMYGGSYNGFTQWAAAKHLPAALKAIMPSVTMAPGIDWPMEGNIFENFTYSWLPYVARTKQLDQSYYDDRQHWANLNHRWYTQGSSYRNLDTVDGTPNPIFGRWLDHPSYDAYWQAKIPYKQDFASINIPVLTTTGYYDGGQIGALYYFSQHYLYNPRADHYLVIGPYNHIGAQRTSWNVLRGYAIDPVARISVGRDLRYQWFDYVFRGAPKPELLKDRVNYEVMGANVWKHAPSLDAMSNTKLRLYMSAACSGKDHVLSKTISNPNSFALESVDFKDRSDVDANPPNAIIDKGLDRRNALVFVGDPLSKATEVSGLFTGNLDYVTNKKDFDLSVAIYEQMADGRYFQLSWYIARASYVANRIQRELLSPGRRQHLEFRNGRLTSRLLQPGSRIVLVLSVIKQPEMQINYGTGKDVSDETIIDAKTPLHIRWFGDSFITLPIER